MKEINPGIFRAYDIRGLVGRDLDEDFAEELGRACGALFARQGLDRAVLGHDCRASSPAYLERLALGLAASGLDMLAVSLAGTGEDHDRARAGAGLEAALAALRRVDQAKQRLGSATPALHVAFMLLRSGLPGLRRLPGLLAGTGVGQVVVSSLDYVCSAELAGEVLTPAQVLAAEDILRKTAQEAAAQGLALSWLLPRDRAGSAEFCSENVDRALVVAVDGAVHPCVSASLAANRGAAASAEALVFGSVREKTLSDIWVSKEYKAFRKSFGSGDRPLVCRSCPKLRVA